MNAIEHLASLTEEIEDPRVERTRVHRLSDILVVGLLGILSGGNGWQDMELFGAANERWLRQFLALPAGIPSKDTFRRVISRIHPEALTQWMVQWTQALADTSEGRLIPIDGKTLRRSFDRAAGATALHLVSAWAQDQRLTLGQVAVAEKSNEITAIPQLLAMIDIQGAVVTIDAMGCQTAIADQIIEQQGDYILAVKGNQASLEEACYEAGSEYQEHPQEHPEVDKHVQTEQNRGRQEERHCFVYPLPADSAVRQRWRGAQALVHVICYRTEQGQVREEVRSYVTSLLVSASLIAKYIRGHWGIENTLHWVMDVTFREDESRIRKDHGAENVACLRRMAAGMLQQEKERQLARGKPSKYKLSMRQKRLLASWNRDYLLEVLAAQRD